MPISDISVPTSWIEQIIKVLILNNISSINSSCIDEFSAIRIESFIVYLNLELVKFYISTCGFSKRVIRVYTNLQFTILEVIHLISGVHFIRLNPICPKPNRPKMILNYRKIVWNITRTIPYPSPNPNWLLQQCLEVYASPSPNDIIFLVAGIISFVLMGFSVLGFGLMGTPRHRLLLY